MLQASSFLLYIFLLIMGPPHQAYKHEQTRDSVKYAASIITERTFLSDLHTGKENYLKQSEKLAVMIPFTFPVHPMTDNMSKRLDFLRCSLHNIKTHIAPWTPLDIFIWINETTKDHFPSWVAEEYPEVVLMPTPESSWVVPPGIIHDSKWVFRGVHSLGYYLMGRWRMTYAFDFVRAMGYSYMLQMDDDAFVVDDLDFNIVEYFREHDVYMGFRNNAHYDDIEVLTALPELTRRWALVDDGRHFSNLPKGPLFKQFSPAAKSFDDITTKTWLHRRHFLAAFMVFDVNYWFSEDIQSFLNYVFRSHLDLRQRWLEQGTINMVRLLFIPDDNLLLFEGNIIHSYYDPYKEIFAEYMGCTFVNYSETSNSDIRIPLIDDASGNFGQGKCVNGEIIETSRRSSTTTDSSSSSSSDFATTRTTIPTSYGIVTDVHFAIHYTREKMYGVFAGEQTPFALLDFHWKQISQCPLIHYSPVSIASEGTTCCWDCGCSCSPFPDDLYGPGGVYAGYDSLMWHVDYFSYYSGERFFPRQWRDLVRAHALKLFTASKAPQSMSFMQLIHPNAPGFEN